MNTTKKLSLLQILLSVLCAAVLAVYRTGLQATGKGFLLLAMISLVLCIGFSIGINGFRKKNRLRPAEPDKAAYSLIACGGFLLMAAGLLFFFQTSGSMLLRVVGAVLSFVAGLAAVMRLKEKDATEKAAVLSTVPIFMLGFFLLMFYRSNGDNPHLETFGYEIAVFSLAIVGVYFSVSPRFNDKAIWLRLGATAFGLTMAVHEWIYFALRPQEVLSARGITIGALLMLLGCLVLMAEALYCPPQKYPEPVAPKDEEKTEETDETEETSEETDS